MIKFGTDGIRGIYGEELNDKLAYAIGISIGCLKKNCKILIARDTRVSGNKLKKALSLGLLQKGATVCDLGISTTPSVAYLTKLKTFDFGIMITASHNSFEYNGIKIFNENGYKIDLATQNKIEKLLNTYKPQSKKLSNDKECQEELNKVNNVRKYVKLYLNFLRKYVNDNTNQYKRDLKIIIDCANGASYQLAKKVFQIKNINFVFINAHNKGKSINKDCGACYTKELSKKVIKQNADFGFAFDGDADRFIAIDKKGKLIDGDKILLLFALYLKNANKLNKNKVIGTEYTNKKLKLLLDKKNIDFESSGVGDASIIKKLNDEHLSLGGENSGHYIFKDILPSGDGMLSAIIFLNAITNTFNYKKCRKVKLYYVENKKVELNMNKILNIDFALNFISDYNFKTFVNKKKNLLKGTFYFLRKSGTEPLIRINVQGNSKRKVIKVAKYLQKLLFEFIYKN